MFTYSFESQKALYLQLYDAIKSDILSGRLPAGQKLPSKRAAAKHLGVSVITVENAYAALQSEGYLYSLPKRGFFVSEISMLAPPQPQRTLAASVSLPQTPHYRYDFSANAVNAENFPFSIWARLMRATLMRAQESMLSPSPAGGVEELKTAICSHLEQFRNMKVLPEQIIIGAGTEYLYALIVQLLGRDKLYAVQNPGYQKIAKIYQSNGAACVYIEEDAEGISAAQLRQSGADVVHVSPSHHFPSGTVMSAARRHELLYLTASAPGHYIIEDDYDSEFRLAGKPLPTLQSLDNAESVIYVNTFSKSLSPGIRISYMVLPPHLVERFYGTLGFYACPVATAEQYTLAAFISQGYFEKHINRMRNYYKKLRNAILGEIQNSPLSHTALVKEEEAGLHFLLRLRTQVPDAVLKEQAKSASVNISFLSEYYLAQREAAPKHILVMNYSAIKPEDVPAAIAALAEILRRS
ncbi:MAG: PLP-dependent aminotransferase family protein [Clostridia bacterium]|nr:PLP-dependent aminotransferase family protein [Clostridia bacterium]